MSATFYTLDSGVGQYIAGCIFEILISSEAVAPRGGRSQFAYVRSCVASLNADLQQWYLQPEQAQASEIGKLTVSVALGSGGLERPCVHGKAFESRWLFRFALAKLRSLRPAMRAPHDVRARSLEAAGARLEEFYTLIHGHGMNMPAQVCDRLIGISRAHAALARQGGVILAPKHHWFHELCRQTAFTGNPRLVSTYPDESYNQVVAMTARTCHPRRFAVTVLGKLHLYRTCASAV